MDDVICYDVRLIISLKKGELYISGGPAETRPNRATRLTESVFHVVNLEPRTISVLPAN